MCNCTKSCSTLCGCSCHDAPSHGCQLMAVEHSSLTYHQRDQIARVALLRSNAAGARHMAARFDEAAAAINAEIKGEA